MKKTFCLITVFSVVLLTGCASKEIFRNPPASSESMIDKAQRDVSYTGKEDYVVNRSYGVVTKVLKERANECISSKVTSTSAGLGAMGTTYRRVTTVYTPKMVIGKSSARLTVQEEVVNMANPYAPQPPKDGWYMFVLDATPEGNAKTRIKIHHLALTPYARSAGVVAAVRKWAEGTSMECPDMTS